ncbi:MAG: hypothetical protein OHK0024_35550 [Thalassobaculales bacterium]
MDLDEGVIAVGLAGQHAFQPHLVGALAERPQGPLDLGHRGGVAIGLGQFQQFQIVGQIALDRADLADRLFQAVAFAQDGLGLGGIVPQAGIAGQRVQLVKPGECLLPVKDASSAAPARR